MIDKHEHFDKVEWIAAALGILGCGMVAANMGFSKFGWFPYAASELALAWWGWKRQAYALFVMQSVFLLISLIGIYRWFH